MRRLGRPVALLLVVLLGVLGVALTRPPAPYARHVLYLRLRLTGFAGSAKEIQYWVDPVGGRILYKEMMPPSGNIRAFVNNRPVQLASPTWYVLSLARRPDGRCGVTYTTILDSSERGDLFSCAALLALRNAAGVRARAASLARTYGARGRTAGGLVRVPVPAGTDLVPLVLEHWNMKFGYEGMRPGVLTLDRAGGRPRSISGYWREGTLMTEQILAVRDLPPGTLPGDVFDAPRWSLPDRAPALYHALHQMLPWHP